MSSSIGKLENYPYIDEEIKIQTSSTTTPNDIAMKKKSWKLDLSFLSQSLMVFFTAPLDSTRFEVKKLKLYSQLK